jgi:hypothetical protein
MYNKSTEVCFIMLVKHAACCQSRLEWFRSDPPILSMESYCEALKSGIWFSNTGTLIIFMTVHKTENFLGFCLTVPSLLCYVVKSCTFAAFLSTKRKARYATVTQTAIHRNGIGYNSGLSLCVFCLYWTSDLVFGWWTTWTNQQNRRLTLTCDAEGGVYV